ncbi:MAG: outer membrane protein assembly factor BamD [Candidatus Hydrothermales bacterium]
MKKFLFIFLIIFGACSFKIFKRTKPEEFGIESYFAQGVYYFYKGKYEKARFYFNKVLFSGEIREYTDDVQFYIAKSYFLEKQFETASSEYNFLLNQFPNSEHLEEAEFDILKIEILKVSSPSHETGELEKVIPKIDNFLKKYPNSKFSEELLGLKNTVLNILAEKIYSIARLYENLKKYYSAEIYYKELIDKYPDTIWAEKARKKINKK